jgi:hypothetical protein
MGFPAVEMSGPGQSRHERASTSSALAPKADIWLENKIRRDVPSSTFCNAEKQKLFADH